MRIPALPLKRKQWEPLAFASPSMALIALVIVFPLAYSFYLPFQNFDLSVGHEYEFVGAKNYTEAIERRGPDKQKAAWGEKLAEMKQLGIEYHADWAAKAK